MEHDAVHMVDAVGQRAGQMVLRGADGTAIRYADVARDQARRGVFLPERSQALQRLDGIDGKLAQTDVGIDGQQRMEAAFRQRIHIGAQPLGEFRELVGRKRDAHGGFMAAETRKDVGGLRDGFEQIDLTDAAA